MSKKDLIKAGLKLGAMVIAACAGKKLGEEAKKNWDNHKNNNG